MRHAQRNPQKSPADPVPDPEKIVKQKKTSQKGASGSSKPKQSYVSLQERLVAEHAHVENLEGESGSGKPKQSYVSLQERLVVEHAHVENIERSTISEEILSEIHKSPCTISSPLDLNPKKPFLPSISFLQPCHSFLSSLPSKLPIPFHLPQSWQASKHP